MPSCPTSAAVGDSCRQIELLGVHIHAMRMADLVLLLDQCIQQRMPMLIGVVNVAKLVNMRHDEDLRQSVTGADIILADGMGIVWASRLLKKPLPERVTGIDLMEHLLRLSDQKRYRVFCLGASEEVLADTVQRIRHEFPNAIIAGAHHGYFKADEERVIVQIIRESAADILLVAMSSPRKERFLARWSADLAIPVCHGVGGAFDVFSGKVQRAPRLWQKSGLEWLYRVIQEPGRLWKRYLITNTIFLWLVLKERLGSR